MTRGLSLWAPVALNMAVIFYASAQPDLALPPGLSDKPAHTIAYTPLGFLFARALAGGLRARIGVSTVLLAMGIATLYGATLEAYQMFVPGRFAEWKDLVANTIGAALGAFVCWLWGIIRLRIASRDASRHGL